MFIELETMRRRKMCFQKSLKKKIMPRFTIDINIDFNKDPALVKEFSKTLGSGMAAILEKPEKWSVIVLRQTYISFGGDSETPAAQVDLLSIGSINLEKNTKISALVAECLEKFFKVSKERYYLNFIDVAAGNLGWGGYTFGNLPESS
jgi:phenylpyruvate tautomerase